MGVLLPILAGILWLCILLYEKGVLQGAVSQSVLLENMKEEKAETGTKAPEKNSLGRAKLYFELTRTDRKLVAEGEGSAAVPGIASVFLAMEHLSGRYTRKIPGQIQQNDLEKFFKKGRPVKAVRADERIL